MSASKKLIVICGPTAVGKTDLAIEKALQYGTAIISADSRQCYRELNIGVAKPTEDQLNRVRHYFINSHSIRQDVNAAVFERYALQSAEKIFASNDVAVMAGGTGLYVKAFLEGMDVIPPIKKEVRSEIAQQYQQSGIDWLVETLQYLDPRFVEKGEMSNPQRMMRALEVKMSSGRSILDFQSNYQAKRAFEVEKIFINTDREELYRRINARVDAMVAQGLVEEATALSRYRELNALQTVGYREIFEYLDGHLSLEKAIELIKRNTRHYAKRQLTWFKKYFIDETTKMIVR